jgi:hypothetical protein
MTTADFQAVEDAVMQTERGRWFLHEFARRRRAEDATRLHAAIDRLEARTAEAEAAETRKRLEWERSAIVLRELANLLRELRPAHGEHAPPPRFARIAAAPSTTKEAGELETRLAALAHIDSLDVEQRLKLFG